MINRISVLILSCNDVIFCVLISGNRFFVNDVLFCIEIMVIMSKKMGSNGSECLDGGDKDILLSFKEDSK